MTAPVVETPRLILRGRTMADFPAYAAIWADQDVTRHIGAPLSLEDSWTKFARMAGFWSLCGYGFWLIEEKATGAMIGEAGAADFKRDIEPSLDGKPEFGWVLAASAHGKGYASEALRGAMGWVEKNVRARASCCIIDPDNAASIRVAEKAGFTRTAATVYKNHDIIVFERRAS